ncbi:MAG: lysostaphin resistance A-like protein [Bacillota bacterium]
MSQPEPFPKIIHALLLLLFFLYVQCVAMVILKIDRLDKMLPDSYLMAIINMFSFGTVIATGYMKTGRPFKEVFPLRSFTWRVIPGLCLAVVGLHIILSEADNFIRYYLTLPDFMMQVMEKLLQEKGVLGPVLLLVAVAPLTEELFFRGLVLQGFIRRYGLKKSILASAALFSLFHLNPYQLLAAFVAGILLGWVAVKSGSLYPAFLGHALHNAMPFIVPMLNLRISGYTIVSGNGACFQPLWFDALGVLMALAGMIMLRDSLKKAGGVFAPVK